MGEECFALRPLPTDLLQLAADGVARLQQVVASIHPSLLSLSTLVVVVKKTPTIYHTY